MQEEMRAAAAAAGGGAAVDGSGSGSVSEIETIQNPHYLIFFASGYACLFFLFFGVAYCSLVSRCVRISGHGVFRGRV